MLNRLPRLWRLAAEVALTIVCALVFAYVLVFLPIWAITYAAHLDR